MTFLTEDWKLGHSHFFFFLSFIITLYDGDVKKLDVGKEEKKLDRRLNDIDLQNWNDEVHEVHVSITEFLNR